MEPAVSMPHSQGLPNNHYPEPNQPSLNTDTHFFKIHSKLSSHLHLDIPKDLFPLGLPVKILKALLRSSILVTWPAHLNPLDLIIPTILGKRYKL